MKTLLKASQERNFPYTGDTEDGSHITYVLTEKATGYSLFFRPEFTEGFKREIMSAVASVKSNRAVLTAVWSGRYISKVFLIDDLELLTTAVNKDISGDVKANPVSFVEYVVKQEEESRRNTEYQKALKKFGDFLDSYTPNEDRYVSIAEIEEFINHFVSDSYIRRACKEHDVPFRYENRPCGKAVRSIKCFSLNGTMDALKKEHHK